MSCEKLKVLTIGNSFTDSLAIDDFWVKAANSAGCELHFERANHGGCELHRHWSYIYNEEKDGAYRMYQDYTAKMREILAREQWDIVTIQQASHFSWRAETYQPFADNICDYIRKHAPQAEIVIQQTWAYREDDPRIRPGGEWTYGEEFVNRCKELGATVQPGPFHISQTDMYNALTEAYRAIAKKHNLRIIPTGYAVQLSRKYEKNPFKPYAPELPDSLRWPDLPSQSGDVVGQMWWQKDEEGKMKIGRDSIHLNPRGRYLQACVWFAMLFGHKTSEITFVPDMIADDDAAELRRIAQQAVDEFVQEK